jgi:hypothetical protein
VRAKRLRQQVAEADRGVDLSVQLNIARFDRHASGPPRQSLAAFKATHGEIAGTEVQIQIRAVWEIDVDVELAFRTTGRDSGR